MPRSGSTLIQNILYSHPEIYATPTSGLIDLLLASRQAYTKSPLFKAQDEKEMKSAFLYFCRYGLQGYFEGLTDRPYVVDKSRGWAINQGFLKCFYQNPKVICIVRDLRDILTSMEKNYRKHPDKNTMPAANNVSERITIWMKEKPVGDTLSKLHDVIKLGYDKGMLFIRFEDLTTNPQKELNRIHKYFDIPLYRYDFNNIEQKTYENDKFHGIFGDHKISSSVKPVPSVAKDILGELLCEQIYSRNKWYFDYFNYEK